MTGRQNYKSPKDLRDIHSIPSKDADGPHSSRYGMDTPETTPVPGFEVIGDGSYRRRTRNAESY